MYAHDDPGHEQLYIVATCDSGNGNSCKKQRTCLPAKNKGNRSQGRPIGSLVAWLAADRGATCKSKRRHNQAKLDYATRVAAREAFKLLVGANEFLELERDRWPGEGEEPAHSP